MAQPPKGDAHLRCNVSACRLQLASGAAWATFCSHVFCDPCGAAAARSGACPACRVNLGTSARGQPQRIRLVKVGLCCDETSCTRRIAVSPRPEEVAMLVAGLRPRTILAACSAGMAFYLHQVEEEGRLQERRLGKLEDRLARMKEYHDQVVLHYKARVTELELELAARGEGGAARGQGGAPRGQGGHTSNLLAIENNQGSLNIDFAAFDPTRAVTEVRRSYSRLPGAPSQEAWRQRGPKVARVVPRSAPSLGRPGPLF